MGAVDVVSGFDQLLQNLFSRRAEPGLVDVVHLSDYSLFPAGTSARMTVAKNGRDMHFHAPQAHE
jgi:hypothetical protein